MTPTDPQRTVSSLPFSRRTLVGSGLVAAALMPLGSAPTATAATGAVAAPRLGARQDFSSDPTSWHTWILSSPDELRPAAPSDPTPAEIAEVLDLQAALTDAEIAAVRQWSSRPAVLPWTELGTAALDEFLSPTRQYRANGLLQAAMYDAVVAAYDAQDAYHRPVPPAVDERIVALDGVAADRPSFPSAEAAVAGAAAAVLTALLPDAAPGRFMDLADDATTALLQAGVAFPSDVDAGLAIGQAVGERAIALAADDQPESAWDGSGRLTGDGYWAPTPPWFDDPPMEPLAPTWRRWVLSSGDQFRPAPPPAFGTPAYESQLGAVREAVERRTMAQERAAAYWHGSASIQWGGFAIDLISRHGLDLPHAARVLALTGIAIADAEIAVWDAKYAYWTARPITIDPDLDVQFPTPPFPSYPSAHSTVCNAAAVVLAHLFPNDEVDLLALAMEAAASRAWAGIHFPVDNDAGTLLGRQVGYLVTEAARQDGAE
jgi:membrane-associated phospholipid phosphatase